MMTRRCSSLATFSMLLAVALLAITACRSDRADDSPDASLSFVDAAPSHKVGDSPYPTGTGLYYGTSGVPSTSSLAPGVDGGFLRSNAAAWSSQYIQASDVPYYPTFAADDFDSGLVKATYSLYAEPCFPVGNFSVCSIPLAGWTGDSTTWVTVGQIKPATSTGTQYDVAFFALDKGQDAGGVVGNQAKCNLEFGVTVTAAGVVNMVAAAGSAGPSTVSIPLACVSAFAVGGADGGPDAGVASQATGFTFQALNTSGVVAFQVKGPDSHYWQVGGAIQRAVLQ